MILSRPFFWTLTLLAFSLLSSPASAQTTTQSPAKAESPSKEAPNDEDTKEKAEDTALSSPAPGLFAPDFCDFQITFPEKPAVTEKCLPDAGCFYLNSYTMVYDLQTTVDISANCTPSTPANKARYKENVMRIALESMARQRGLKEYQIQYDTIEGVKNAVLTGLGQRGAQEEIFISQLWVGDNSIFTVQAELIGTAHSLADKSFHDILASIKFKKGKQLPTEPKHTPKINR